MIDLTETMFRSNQTKTNVFKLVDSEAGNGDAL